MRLLPCIFYIASVITVSACTSGGNGSDETQPTPVKSTPAIVIPVEPTVTVVTSEQIDVAAPDTPADLKPIGDGVTNNTAVFQRLLGNGDRHVLIPAGDYVIDALRIPPNTILELEPGTILRDSGNRGPGVPLLSIRDDGVQIIAQGATLLADRAAYPDGEYRHGVSIVGARRVIIEGLESTGNAGDGFYIGGGDVAAEDIVLRGCRADNNKRQGLSITSARRVYVTDSEFMNTKGTAPEAGIDIEPNHPTDVLDQITLVRPQTMNNRGGGLRIDLNQMTMSSEPGSVTIVDPTSSNEQPPYQLLHGQVAPITVSIQIVGP